MPGELADWKRAFQPCRIPAIAALVLLGIAIYCFNAAKDIRLPYDPAKLNTIQLRVDKVASCDAQARIRGRLERYTVPCVYSGNYPYMVFKFFKATYNVRYTEGEHVEFMVLEDQQQLTDGTIARQYNMAIPVRVYGVRKNGETLVDAKQVHDQSHSRKVQFNMNGWIALVLAGWAALITFRRARKILNEAMW
ncbi:hypothetical protein LMG26684_01426 [Achromobacter mucicolens]|uniref:hypothetical protein n=1 Tax=Achromobacter mucicolens TaxID=1389922 RepID=UPI00146814F0|nr:hypothetical protein [Achromobacter mucicolens]CAB3838189.1 hypothetical protein LMG26684_01426 [Achromobacter mucicolens]